MTNEKCTVRIMHCCCEFYWRVVHWPIYQTSNLIVNKLKTFRKALIIKTRHTHLLLWFAGRRVGCVPCHRLGLRFPLQFVILNFLQWVMLLISLSCSIIRFSMQFITSDSPLFFLKQSLLAWYLLWPNNLKQTIMFMQQTNKWNK